MAQIGITKMSSKGQIVIPQNLRNGIKEGDQLIAIRSGDHLILKKADAFDKQIQEDLEFARRTERAYRRIEAGHGTKMEFDSFIKALKKW